MKIPIRTTEAQHHEQNRTTVSDSFLSTRRIPALIMVAVILMLSLTTIYSHSVSADLTSSYGELWVTQQAAGRISILHPQSVLAGSAVETISLPAGAHPHITTFSPDSKFAYVSDMGNGTLYVIRADDREIVGALHLAPTLVHQAKPSPALQDRCRRGLANLDPFGKPQTYIHRQGTNLYRVPQRRTPRLCLASPIRHRGRGRPHNDPAWDYSN